MRPWQGATRWSALAAAILGCLVCVPAVGADPPPPGSSWHEEYITAPDGTKLHADVLRPKDLPASARTPVILSIGPYFNHSGQTGPAGPAEDTPYTPLGDDSPSARFFDFVNGAQLMKRHYTYVMVDLRGFGGSSGCLDWVGPGEQSDVKTAVEWAASRSWSTGKVGMYGKSYDGVTGLVGVALKPRGLAAVVAQEPVYDLYRYLYARGVRYQNSLLTPALYDLIADTPGAAGDTPEYNQNSLDDLARPGCPALNWLDQQDSNHDAPYWRARNLIDEAEGSTVPLFMTQGFLEDNTKPDGAFHFFHGLKGPKRAWFGMWDHVRGNDTDDDGRLKMGRKGWFDEVMRWYDRYLKGIAPSQADPPLAVQSSDGRWRSESSWPPADARDVVAGLRPGTYLDTGVNNGTASAGPPYGDGVWTFSPPFGHLAHLAGVPRVELDLGVTLPKANVVVDVYDVDGDGGATLISRGTYLVPGSGKLGFTLYGDDWIMRSGHRIGVLVTSSNAEWWMHAPTGQQVTVNGGRIRLPFLHCRRTAHIQGDPSIKLEDYRDAAPLDVSSDTIAGGTDPAFPVPDAPVACG